MSEIRLHAGDTCGLADGFHDGNTRHDSDGARQRAGARWRRVAFTGDAEMDMGRIRADRAPAARALRIAALGALLALGLVAGGCGGRPLPVDESGVSYCETSVACVVDSDCGGGVCVAPYCAFPIRQGCRSDEECESPFKCLCGICGDIRP